MMQTDRLTQVLHLGQYSAQNVSSASYYFDFYITNQGTFVLRGGGGLSFIFSVSVLYISAAL